MSETTNKNHVTIEATLRAGRGKTYTRKLRAAGKCPAVFNSKGSTQAIEFDPKMLSRAWRDGGKVFDLVLEGKTTKVKITELQIHPVRRIALHCDLSPAD